MIRIEFNNENNFYTLNTHDVFKRNLKFEFKELFDIITNLFFSTSYFVLIQAW